MIKLKNLVNFHDLRVFIWAIKYGLISSVISKLTKSKKDRVKDAWKVKTKKMTSSWWIIPEVEKHWNYLISGDENVDFYQYICDKYFSGKNGLKSLSLGCGTGVKELKWAELGNFEKMEAFDISENRIKFAKEQAQEKGYGNILDFRMADIYTVELQENYYNAIIVDNSLHHFSPLEELLLKINRSLSHDGYFIVNEFVGPTRFQWTDKQLKIANSVRKILPEKYRAHIVDGCVNRKIIRPSLLNMTLKDPSEAVESSNIMPLLKQIFDIVEVRPYNGAILNLVLGGIAHNFVCDDAEAKKYLRLCQDIDDLLTETGQVESDFVVAVCKKKG
ncbi:class I SAM-dependent methyltransferase [Planctomycetota bacterium]